MSTLSDILGGVGSAAGTGLDYLAAPGRYTRGAIAGRPGQKMDGREMLESMGMLGANTPGLDWGDAAGFAADVAIDPLNLIPIGAIGKLLGLSRKARLAEKIAAPAAAMESAPSAWAQAVRAAANGVDLNDLRQTRKMTLRDGAQAIASHYARKLEESGGENVVNPRSGLRLWANPERGRADLQILLDRQMPVTESRQALGSRAQYQPGSVEDVLGVRDEAGRLPMKTFLDNGAPVIERRLNRELQIPPTVANSPRDLFYDGAHEGMHAIEDVNNLHPDTEKYLKRVTEAAGRMWQRQGHQGPPYIPPLSGLSDVAAERYLSHPREIVGRIAPTRLGLEEAGLSTLPVEPRITIPGSPGEGFSTNSFAPDLHINPDARQAAEELRAILGPRLTNLLLRTMPAVPAVGAGAAAAYGGNLSQQY